MLYSFSAHFLQLFWIGHFLVLWFGQVAAAGHQSDETQASLNEQLNAASTEAAEYGRYSHLYPVRVSQLDLQRFINCMNASIVKGSPVRYAVQNRVLTLVVALEDVVSDTDEDNNRLHDCDHAVHENATILDYIQFGTWRGSVAPKSIEQASSDPELVATHYTGHTAEAPNNATHSFAVMPSTRDALAATSLQRTAPRSDFEKRATNMRIEFDGPAPYKNTCDNYVETCINQRRWSPKIRMVVYVPRIQYASAWSHHWCEYKGKDNDKKTIQVNRQGSWFTIDNENGRGWYSGGVSKSSMGLAWGNGKIQNHCGSDWNNNKPPKATDV